MDALDTIPSGYGHGNGASRGRNFIPGKMGAAVVKIKRMRARPASEMPTTISKCGASLVNETVRERRRYGEEVGLGLDAGHGTVLSAW